jgi:hypothetical protein
MVSEAEFWKLTYPKLLPSRAQMEVLDSDKLPDESRAKAVIEDLLRFSRESRKRAVKEALDAEADSAGVGAGGVTDSGGLLEEGPLREPERGEF